MQVASTDASCCEMEFVMKRNGLNHQIKISSAAVMVALLFAGSTHAVQVQDLTRIKGAESNKLVGMGIVVGLKGTGDGGKFEPSMRALAEVTKRLIDPSTVALEMKNAKNVALVTLTANLKPGVVEGDKVDVHVSAVAASSLKGGRLFMVPMTGPLPNSPVYAFAEGGVIIEDDETPTVGVVRNGAQMTKSVYVRYLDEAGRMTLVLNDAVATLPMANNLANLINGLIASPTGPKLAVAVDQKNVVVAVPEHERRNLSSFISGILQTYVAPEMINTGARVVINEKTGTIVFSHNIQISPVGITHAGMTINMITPQPEPDEQNPKVERNSFVGIDPDGRGGARLADLVRAFNQLKVEAKDRIAIIREMHKHGALHAQLIIE